MEQWRDIPGFEGRYQVSDLGRVRGPSGKVLKPGRCRGYLIVHLFPKGTIAIHLLVARVFVPGAAPGLEANHKDGVKTNCVADNLEWLTKRENQRHAVRLGLKTQAVRVAHPATGVVYPSIAQASRELRCRASTIRTSWPRA